MKNKIAIENLIIKQGFKVIKYVRHTQKNVIFITKKKNKNYFIKITQEKDSFDNLINEVKANDFINKIKPKDLPLYIPKSILIKKENYLIGVFELISGKSFADQDTMKIVKKISSSDLEKFFQILLFYTTIKEQSIPHYFMDKARMNFTKQKMIDKFNSYLESVHGKMINKDKYEKLLSYLETTEHKRSFQHHDFVLWNIFKNKKNQIVLIDAEFSRWGIAWYDLAYYFIQTYIYLKNPPLAKKSLKFFIKRFKQESPNQDIEKEIFFPLTYRISANLKESYRDRKMEKFCKELLNRILTNDINELLK